ncbi:ribulose-phosphate 3-epimerase [Lacticaseibacillus camelliae DSM 22697 = JCM 13995]|uniref:Ribulose-phosphate 3-epimerase n=1 Tax=Lacticaseibacillus camelliae DSM 22697 = JCM 13995 TaxID=1423730 RepID=A0A0R2EP00_9LACO|nr:ribulose-phosphate 3-epimerase [Lacticaseibacillus camelliae DSM 22697 = JCM 13995]
MTEAGAKTIHIDVMDGAFVPNLSYGPQIVAALRKETNAKLEVHLMVQNPENLVQAFIDAGADSILVHVEATQHIHRALSLIKAAGKEAGVVINPGTSVSTITPLLRMVDQVLVMTVDPGFGGQKFLPETTAKLDLLRELRGKTDGYDYKLEVDGGVNEATMPEVQNHGVDLAVAGSAVFDGIDAKKNFQKLAEEAG